MRRVRTKVYDPRPPAPLPAKTPVVYEIRGAGARVHYEDTDARRGRPLRGGAGGKTLCGTDFVPRVSIWSRDPINGRRRPPAAPRELRRLHDARDRAKGGSVTPCPNCEKQTPTAAPELQIYRSRGRELCMCGCYFEVASKRIVGTVTQPDPRKPAVFRSAAVRPRKFRYLGFGKYRLVRDG